MPVNSSTSRRELGITVIKDDEPFKPRRGLRKRSRTTTRASNADRAVVRMTIPRARLSSAVGLRPRSDIDLNQVERGNT
jgi:hypothetical protein